MSNSTGQSADGFHLLRLGECSLRCPKRLGAFRHARFQGLIELAERFRASRALGHVIAYLPLPPACPQRRADRTGQAHGVEGPLQKNDIPEHLWQMQLRNHAACCRPAGTDKGAPVFPMTEVAVSRQMFADILDEGTKAKRLILAPRLAQILRPCPTTFVRGVARCASDPEGGACPRKLGNPGSVGLGRTIVGAILLWLLGIPIPIIILLLLLWH